MFLFFCAVSAYKAWISFAVFVHLVCVLCAFSVEHIIGLYGFMHLCISLYFIWRSHTDQCDVYDIHGNNFVFCFPKAPPPTTLKVCPNSDSWLRGHSNHISHSWLNVHPELTQWCFHRTSSSGKLAGGNWSFSSFVLVIFFKGISIIPQYILMHMYKLTNQTEKIPHTGDTNSLDRCG